MDIVVRDLSKAFGENKVLRGISHTFCNGQTSIIMGASGCGKTTLLMILMGLMKADCGTVEGLDGKSIAAVFQEDRLCENLSVYRNVRMVCTREDKQFISKALDDVGLSEFVSSPVRELSGGMKRRVAIVRSVAAKSDVLIMDEPFKGLDGATKNSVMQFVKRNTVDTTLIIVTHDLTEAAFFGGDVINMKDGALYVE